MTFKKGDLVMVVRPMPCCGAEVDMGRTEAIGNLEPGFLWECRDCLSGLDEWEVANVSGDDAIPTCMLIKINPPADDTEEVADKELEGVV